MRIERHPWIPCSTDDDPEQKMLWSASRIVKSLQSEECPYCAAAGLRFYYHEFDLSVKPDRRGTIWVWCPECKRWTHFSGARLNDNVRYTQVLSDEQIAEFERKHRLLDALNYFWEQGTIPRQFEVG